jgi:hypothetical protein
MESNKMKVATHIPGTGERFRDFILKKIKIYMPENEQEVNK